MKRAACLSGIAAALSLALLGSGPALAQDEVYDAPEESDSSDAADSSAEGDVGLDGLTPLQSWAPPGAQAFRTAAACHFFDPDYYVIFAVFTTTDGYDVWDQLWWVLVDGQSDSPYYGESVDDGYLGRATVIPRVECTTSEADGPLYFVWDRQNSAGEFTGARWAAVSFVEAEETISVSSPVTLPNCGDRASGFASIAYHDGVVAVASGGSRSCGPCLDQYEADGTHIRQTTTGVAGGGVRGTGVEWAGGQPGSFLIAVLYKVENYENPERWQVVTTLVDLDGTYHSPCYGSACIVYDFLTDDTPAGIQLVFSPNAGNPYGYMVIQIDRRTIWVNRQGQLAGDVAAGPWSTFASCEYWGPQPHIAHTFSPSGSYIRHRHWYFVPAPAFDVYNLAYPYYRPAACSAEDGYEPVDDREVLVVRKATLYLPQQMRWGFEEED